MGGGRLTVGGEGGRQARWRRGSIRGRRGLPRRGCAGAPGGPYGEGLSEPGRVSLKGVGGAGGLPGRVSGPAGGRVCVPWGEGWRCGGPGQVGASWAGGSCEAPRVRVFVCMRVAAPPLGKPLPFLGKAKGRSCTAQGRLIKGLSRWACAGWSQESWKWPPLAVRP